LATCRPTAEVADRYPLSPIQQTLLDEGLATAWRSAWGQAAMEAMPAGAGRPSSGA